ncbi:hypothetical protein Hypma_006661 [Hypsizygus marmoreus]|uniref:Uncharacterized protein n=1 Tax=Hypsizygus marmoreus TaxID=39966 RepID=A0A369JWZ2_HYPMA|nr:hypothetical protein Hypma_006661 [Hypsizygus marmoreus]
MFKRVEKRRLKCQEEEELGLDEDMKEVLGMHDTDSEESDSDSDDSGSGEENVGEEEDGEAGNEDVSDAEEFEQESMSDGDQDAVEEEPEITVQEALRDPVYVVSLQPVVKACIVCPGKLLKGTQMVALHRTSNAHERRVKRFAMISKDAAPADNAWDVLRENAEDKPKTVANLSENSKRAEKRRAHAALRKARREKQKVKARAKKTATSAPKPDLASPRPAKPPKKKQKIATTKSASAASAAPMAGSNENTKSTITSIVRSASERAKKARARAVDRGDDGLSKPMKKAKNRGIAMSLA